MKYSSITTYKTIAAVSFLILLSVQFFLVYNTYELKNEHYNITEKGIIGDTYSQSISNDKLFPGGAKIIDNSIDKNMGQLEWLYRHNPGKFEIFKQKFCDSIFTRLRKTNNTDSVLNTVIKKNRLNNDLVYSLTVQSIDVAFQKNKYVSLYNQNMKYPYIDSLIQTKDGILIGGTLKDRNSQNLITNLTISSPNDHSDRIKFSLHVDKLNRHSTILKLMMPTLILALFSILSVIFIYFITFKNWLKQKKLSEMKSDFINSITHEFHTPLAAIIVANKTLQNEKIIANKENVRPLTEVIQRQSERLKMLIGQVLDITTMNQLSLDKKDYQLHNLLEKILLDYRLKLTSDNIHLALKWESTKDEVRLDQFWFTTILLNILDNAIKYNDRKLKEVIITAYNDKRNIFIRIEDNGVGMTDDIQKYIFEKFYRNPHHLNGSVKGLGLGLFYVKQAIDAHNWHIDIKSKPGEGSTFIITIPF